MYAQVERPKEDKSRDVVNSVDHMKSRETQGLWFVDNRPETIQMKRLQLMANISTKSNQAIQQQTTDDNYSHSKNAILSKEIVAQLYRVGYVPNLAQPARAHNGVAYDRGTFDRPGNFDEATIQYVYANAPQMTIVFPPPPLLGGLPTVFYQCASCQKYFQYEAMQIGHIETWADYVENSEPADTAEAVDAYNDIINLHLECATCNAGHAFEELKDMEDDDYDYDDDFIDDSDFNPKETEGAFRDMRENVLPKFKSVGFWEKLQSM